MSTGQPHLDMTLDPCVASMHHRDARRQAMASVASTSIDPLIAYEMGTNDTEEDLGFETRMKICSMIIFVMFFPKRVYK